jgi:hypothetical protein
MKHAVTPGDRLAGSTCPIVGIGCSAGGIDALEAELRARQEPHP